MKAIILAAGRGSRMAGLTEEKPKCLVELRGKSLLQYQIDALGISPIEAIGIVTGYKNTLLQSYNLYEFHNKNWSTTNMVSSLESASEWLEKNDCIISYSDIFYDRSAIQKLSASTSDISILYDVNWRKQWESRFENPLDDAETFRIDEDGNILEIGSRTNDIESIQGQYMGLLKISPKAWHTIRKLRMDMIGSSKDKMSMTELIQILIENGSVEVKGVPFEGQWGEIDSESDLNYFKNNNQ